MMNKNIMRVAIYYSNSDIRIQKVGIPKINDDEILMRVEASGICGSDVMFWYRAHKVPLVLGHEVAGVVEEIGKNAAGFKKGDRIACSHHVPCGECHFCKMGHETTCDTLRKTNFDPGGFCEYLRIPTINIQKKGVYHLPDNISFQEGSFTEPLACVIRGQRIANFKKGKSVLVLGSGISGILHIQLAKLMGASCIFATDVDNWRLKKAREFGADHCIHASQDLPSKIIQLNNGLLSDLVILTTGARSAILQAITCVERGGTILFFAATNKGVTMELNINDIFWRNEVTLTSSYAANEAEHLQAIDLINSKKINVKDMITHVFGLKDIVKGFNLVEEARESLKVIIEPQR